MIRFACLSCRSVLSIREEHAGKIVTCPKCGQRMQVPRPPQSPRTPHEKTSRRRNRPLIAGAALVGALLLIGLVSGVWLGMHTFHREPEPIAENIGSATVREQPFQPLSPPEKGAETERGQPSQPLADARGSEEPPRQDDKPTVAKPPSPDEEKKDIDLADDLPPELPFDLVDAVNIQRAKAGVEPIFLDAEVSRNCQSRAEDLARHAGRLSQESQKKESVAEEAPLEAVEKWLKEPKQRAAILEPRLRNFGAGFARNVEGQWFSVFDWTSGFDREPLSSPSIIPLLREKRDGTSAIVYPAPAQRRVPLWFPGNETPDPLPQTKDKLAGYPITLTFPPQLRIENADAHLSNSAEKNVSIWLSSPAKPANRQFSGSQLNTICLIAKKPLLPNTRYRVEASATVNGAAWSAKWDFTTISEGEIHHELAGAFLRMLNGLRRRAGLSPVPLDAERSKACASHARYLAGNALSNPALNWNDEKAELPGYSREGAAVAQAASIQGGGGPTEAVAGLIDSLISRPQLLDPRLHDLGLGYTPFTLGGWIWVIDLHRGTGHDSDKEYFYPAPNQQNVPLVYPPTEVPSPIPARSHAEGGNEEIAERGNEKRLAGYAVTVLFGPRTRVTSATAKLVDDKGTEVAGWFSTPENPAIPGFQQRSLCFLPKAPLRPDTRYTATFRAEVNDKPWRRTWSFSTLKEPDRYSADLDEKITAKVNTVRKAAGLSPVRLDAELSIGCQSHALYLARNHRRPEILGMGMHRQDADLPGASPQGSRAAKESVIAVILDPQTCVENWMATLYHRIPILAPNLVRVGFGHARVQGNKWVCVLDTGTGRTPQRNAR